MHGEDYNGFGLLWRDLVLRAKKPVKHPTFWFYLFVAVILFGGLGIWIEVIKWLIVSAKPEALQGVIISFVAFFCALTWSSAFEVVLSKSIKMLKGLAVLVAVISLIAAIFLGFGVPLLDAFEVNIPPEISIILAVFCSVLSVALWWIANSSNATYLDDVPNDDASLGGDPSAELHGDLNGYST